MIDVKAIIEIWEPRVRAYFSNFPWRNMLAFLFFLLMAYIFWLMLFFRRENVEGTYRVPVKYMNVPEDVVFDQPTPQHIDVRISDVGSQIFRYDIFKPDTLRIDVGEYHEKNIQTIQGNELRYILNNLFPKATLLSYYPALIPISTSKLEKKQLSVVFDGEITTSGANLVTDSISFIPEIVTAYSSKKILENLTNALTEYTVFDNLKATSQFKIKIKKVEGVKFVPDEVEIYIPIKEYTEKSFDIPITCSNLPDNLEVKFFPSQIKVSFLATLEDYKKISPEDFAIDLDYTKLKSQEDGKIEIELTQSPAMIRNPRLSPGSVEFLFENLE